MLRKMGAFKVSLKDFRNFQLTPDSPQKYPKKASTRKQKILFIINSNVP
jgi:hypothetical protein